MFCVDLRKKTAIISYTPLTGWFLQGASRETDVFEMDVTEQVEGVEAWVGGN
jgi:hypothetical protein